MPVAANAVTGDVARFAVVDPQVQGLTVIGPLLAAIVTGDHGELAGLIGIRSGGEWWPVAGAAAVAGR